MYFLLNSRGCRVECIRDDQRPLLDPSTLLGHKRPIVRTCASMRHAARLSGHADRKWCREKGWYIVYISGTRPHLLCLTRKRVKSQKRKIFFKMSRKMYALGTSSSARRDTRRPSSNPLLAVVYIVVYLRFLLYGFVFQRWDLGTAWIFTWLKIFPKLDNETTIDLSLIIVLILDV